MTAIPDECVLCQEPADTHTHPTNHAFIRPTQANKLRTWAMQQFTGESRALMLAGADALDTVAALSPKD